MIAAYTGRGSKILRLSLAKSAAVVDSAAVSESNGEDSAAFLPSADEAQCDNPDNPAGVVASAAVSDGDGEDSAAFLPCADEAQCDNPDNPAGVVASAAVSGGDGGDSAAFLPSATGGDSDSDDHVSPSVSGDDDNLSDVFEFPLKFCNQPNTGTISTAVDAASNEDQGSIDVASESDSLVAGNC